MDNMRSDPLSELPTDPRDYMISEIRSLLGVDRRTAEDLVRSAEPFWDAMERAGGLVDAWGGGEFCWLLPRVLAFIRDSNGG